MIWQVSPSDRLTPVRSDRLTSGPRRFPRRLLATDGRDINCPMLTADEAYAAHLRNTTVADCRAKGWALILQCQACRRSVEMAAEAFDALPGSLTLEKLAGAARCSACGGLGAWIDERQAQNRDGAGAWVNGGAQT